MTDYVSFPPLAFFFITGRPVQSITFTRGSRSPLFFSLLYSESGIASFLSDKFSEQYVEHRCCAAGFLDMNVGLAFLF